VRVSKDNPYPFMLRDGTSRFLSTNGKKFKPSQHEQKKILYCAKKKELNYLDFEINRSSMNLLKKFLFTLDPERAHHVALILLQCAYRLGFTQRWFSQIKDPYRTMGLLFPNRIGLAAGFDKNADYVDALASLGFGFIEIGTVTPKAQMGNPRPRLFRLTECLSIINRLGFNNKGIDYVEKKLSSIKYQGILGINIGKNRDTPIESAFQDYIICFQRLAFYASYIAINISSPNTGGLRDLQKCDALTTLLRALKREQQHFFAKHKKYVPLVVKISPDLSFKEVNEIATILREQKIDGVIATNTSIHREGLEKNDYKNELGGLSGKLLEERSTQILEHLQHVLKNDIPIIGVGGIMDRTSAKEKIAAGACLIQIYTGFIYKGPKLINELAESFLKLS